MTAGAAPRAVIAWVVLLLCVTQVPYVVAACWPPPGRSFVGTFHWIDDFYNYVSYVQQAEDGALLFENKLTLTPHTPVLFNLEWWLVGLSSRALGRRPFLAYRLLAAVCTVALCAGIDRWARRCGLPGTHRAAALTLVTVGGGLGGWLFDFTDLPVSRCLELGRALFPFVGMLSNPHFVAGTALLLWALDYFAAARTRAETATAIALGTVLAVVRPYDAATLVAVRVMAVLSAQPSRAGLRRLVPLLGLAPAILYDVWVFFASEGFRFLSRIPYGPENRIDFAPALAPALVLAALVWRHPPLGGEPAERIRHLVCWAALGGALIAANAGYFVAQHLVGLGLPLLLLGAVGLSRCAPAWTSLAAIGLSFTSIVALRIELSGDPNWFVPKERVEAALALRQSCARGDVFLGPGDVGLYVAGLTACRAVLSHPVAPRFEARLAGARAFYGADDPAARNAWLDELCVTHLALPGDQGDRPQAWLGPATRFGRVGSVGSGERLLSLYARARPARCRQG